MIESGDLARELNLPELNVEEDRVMICGSIEFNADLKTMLEARSFTEGANNKPAEFVIELAFVG